jgi:hypothetical protein
MIRVDQAWSHEDIDLLCKLWKEGVATKEIAKKVQRKQPAVIKYVSRNRKKLGLEQRGMTPSGRKPNPYSFDELWSGVIPCGHWMITKPWR